MAFFYSLPNSINISTGSKKEYLTIGLNGAKRHATVNAKTYDGWTYTWTRGRQLKSLTKTGVSVEYAYDASGLRVQKKVTEGTTVTITDYRLHGKLPMHLTEGKVVNGAAAVVQQLHFYYDAQSRPMMVKYGDAYYASLHNLQGDWTIIKKMDRRINRGNDIRNYFQAHQE